MKFSQYAIFEQNGQQASSTCQVLDKIVKYLVQHPQNVRYCLKPACDADKNFIDFVFTQANEAACAMIGAPLEALLGRQFRTMLGISAGHPFYKKYLRASTSTAAFVEVLPPPFGGKKWVSHLITKFHDEISISINLVNPLPTFILDKQQNKQTDGILKQKVSLTGKVLEMNDLTGKCFGFRRFREGTLFMNQLLHPRSKLAYQMAVRKSLTSKAATNMSLILTTKDHCFVRVKGVLLVNRIHQKVQSISQSFEVEEMAFSVDDIKENQQQPKYLF